MSLGRFAHAFLRIGAGLLFIEHGLQKMFGMLGGVNASGATVPLASMEGMIGALEVVGGALVIIGLATRPIAALLMVEMIAAYFLVNAEKGGWPIQNKGELSLIYAMVFAYLAGNRPGLFSIDELLFCVKLERRGSSNDRRHDIPLQDLANLTPLAPVHRQLPSVASVAAMSAVEGPSLSPS